jgi:hypothetical protein
VVLVAGMEDAAEVGLDGAADEGGAVHDPGDVFEALADFEAVDGGVDGGEGAEHLRDFEALFEGVIAFGVEGVGSGHAAGHPEEDAGVGFGGGMSDFGAVGPEGLGFAGGPGGGAGGGEFFEEVAADDGLGGGGVEVHGGRMTGRNKGGRKRDLGVNAGGG